MADWISVHAVNERIRFREVHLHAPCANRCHLDVCLYFACRTAHTHGGAIDKAAGGGIGRGDEDVASYRTVERILVLPDH